MSIGRVFVLTKNVFTEVVRERILFIIGFYALILAAAFRLLPELAASTEDKMFLDFGLAMMSLLGVIVAVFVGTGMVNKEIEKRTLLVLIAKPVNRTEFIISKYLGLSAVLGVLIAAMTIIYLGFLRYGNIPYPLTSILLAVLFLFLQLSLVAAAAIALGVFTNSLLAAPLTFGVYFMGNITEDLLKVGRISNNPDVERLTKGLYLVLPDLSRLNLQNDAVYGIKALPSTSALITSAGYGLLYSAMLLAIAVFLFSRKEF
ncbi:MAG: ABC transporter permease [Scytonematopsis contorta HA4267-MV1]|jgi:ABC-type transport system involved in multi-copper enzyme maturation permease subunit|nr:ABC transporter permease [Scytonematopsis contorta HA4267-MV1]